MTTSDGVPAGWVKGVDASYAELTLEKAQALRAAGVEVWWQCLWTGRERPASAIGNLALAHDAGMTIAAYGSVTASRPGWWHAEKTREGLPNDLWAQLRVVACDVELDGIPVYAVRDFVERIATYGKRRAIYTSWDAWVKKMGNPLGFGDCQLCNALWDENPDVDFAGLRYGPWRDDQVLLEQYSGGEQVEGILIDRDVWNVALLQGDETEGEVDAPTKGEFGALYRLVDAHYNTLLAVTDALIQMARHVYGEDEPLLAQLHRDFVALHAAGAAAAAALPPAQPP